MDALLELYERMGISPGVYAYGEKILDKLADRFAAVDKVAEYNQAKVLAAMQKNRVSAACFVPSTGYGYDDTGRDCLERVYADVFHTEAALVRPQITCGTHALTVALSANLLPGDELLSPVGMPYDTLQEVIGIRESPCSLKEYGVSYRQVDLLPDGGFDLEGIRRAINEKTKLVTIQRSKGYATRPTFSVDRIGKLIEFLKSIKSDLVCMVDNCYGEFVETIEPSDVGADLVVGSLIKNPGGGLATSGGYICGKADLVERCAYRLSAPGLGQEVGANFGVMKDFYQGFFLAPTVVAGAEKGAIFAANLYEPLGFRCVPNASESRHDIIQAVELGSEAGMIAFCQGIQAAAPVDSYATPMPWDMPGYNDQVIMAAGAFVQGSSIELSADGPIRAPFAVYFQGGLTWYHAKLGILMSLQKMIDGGLVSL
ncbi:MAG: methionine gamma-lyase family protein [Candidatus Faecousia sp.]|nr:methionine gamma-lyase family protein [Clostridiales bacterium]MDD6296547.1 methionine gamma-lyase family protein [Bacillota bacterium]MDD7341584.1 methionine gamma-lyase family protein [Bacillota bacterium]MDY2809750.1 methionine gamma-lyase family protein [Candidatus Faecousia sp.]